MTENTAVRVPQLTRDKCDKPRPGYDESVLKVGRSVRAGLLIGKLHAETEEIARDMANPEEYGDVLETLLALAKMMGVTWHEIQQAMLAKRERKGGLDDGRFWVPNDFVDIVTAEERRNAQAA